MLSAFGAPLQELTIDDLATLGTVLQIEVAPNRIDILTSIEAVSFEDAWPRLLPRTYGGVPIATLSINDLITTRTAAGRPQDLIDLAELTQAKKG